MNDPIRIPEAPGSFLCSIQLWRRPDGSTRSVLTTMNPELIETTGVDLPTRVKIISGWLTAGAVDMEKQAKQWAKELSRLDP